MASKRSNNGKKIVIGGVIVWLLWWYLKPKNQTPENPTDDPKIDFDKTNIKVYGGLSELIELALRSETARKPFENKVYFFDKLQYRDIDPQIKAELVINGYIVANLHFRVYSHFDSAEANVLNYAWQNGQNLYGLGLNPKEKDMFIANISWIPSRLAAATNGRFGDTATFWDVARGVEAWKLKIRFIRWGGKFFTNNLIPFTY